MMAGRGTSLSTYNGYHQSVRASTLNGFHSAVDSRRRLSFSSASQSDAVMPSTSNTAAAAAAKEAASMKRDMSAIYRSVRNITYMPVPGKLHRHRIAY